MIEKTIVKGKIGGWRPNSGRKPGFVGYWKGKKRPNYFKESSRRYGKDNHFSRVDYKAENHPRWKGGSWNFWKRKALERDNFTCQICFLHDPDVLQVDHIVPKKITGESYTKGTHDLNNLMTLCANCHARKSRTEKRKGAKGKSYYSL